MGQYHPLTARCYRAIGLVHYQHHNLKLAKEFLLKSFRALMATLGQEHTDVANIYKDLALVSVFAKLFRCVWKCVVCVCVTSVQIALPNCPLSLFIS